MARTVRATGVVVAIGVAGALAGACAGGGSTAGVDTNADASPSSTSGGPDGGESTDGSASLPAPDLSRYSAAAIRKVTIAVAWWDAATGSSSWLEDAHFWISEPPGSPSVQSCTETKVDACTAFMNCNGPPPSTPTAPALLELRPAKVEFVGGTGTGTNYNRWRGGDEVRVRVTGNPAVGIPDFEATSTFPPVASLSSAYGSGRDHIKLYRQSPFFLSYPPGLGVVSLAISQGLSRIQCSFDGQAGKGTVAAELMLLLAKDELSAQNSSTSTGIVWSRVHTIPVHAGSFEGTFSISPAANFGGWAQVFDSVAP